MIAGPGVVRGASLLALLGGLLLLLAACASGGGRSLGEEQRASAQMQPARLAEANQAARLRIEASINAWLGGAPVMLGDSAFVTFHRVTLVPAAGRSLERPGGVDGRMMTEPEQFDLLVAGDRCFLRRARTGETAPLAGVECVPETEMDR